MRCLAPNQLENLRRLVRALDGTTSCAGTVALGLRDIDQRLPGGGLARAALHEVCGSGRGSVDGAAAALFAAGVAARASGPVIWVAAQSDLFAPGLLQSGLDPGRVIQIDAQSDTAVLACCEEVLRHRSVGALVGEVAHLSLTASRRLQLAAEGGQALCLIVRRWKRERDAAAFAQPTAAATRWQVTALPSRSLPVPGLGRARWQLDLLRCKGGEPARFEVEAFDDKACLVMATPLVHRPALQAGTNRGSGRSAAS